MHGLAGGGDGAILAEYLLAALDADDEVPHAAELLTEVVADARLAHDIESEVLALDILARIHADRGHVTEARKILDSADRLTSSAGHLVTDSDRIDGDRARSLLLLAAPRPSK